MDATRSVDTGVMAAAILDDTLVDVLAFKCVPVQSGERKFFLDLKFIFSNLHREDSKEAIIGTCDI